MPTNMYPVVATAKSRSPVVIDGVNQNAPRAPAQCGPPSDRTLKASLRGDGGVHPAVLHHAMRRTEAEIVHMIGNIGPAMYYARRNDQRVTDLQLDVA